MVDLKELFTKSETGTLNYEQFSEALSKAGIKLANLSEGKYVSKEKYEDDLSKRDTQITTLNGTISQRDTDLANIQKQLESAGADQTKLNEVTGQLSQLQSKYDADMQEYKAQLSRQAYEFAVKEFAGSKKFTSPAAKRDFVKTMTDKNLQMENDKILGADDFFTAYKAENEASFVVETPKDEPKEEPTPHFVWPTGNETPKTENASPFNFSFIGVRNKE